MYWPKLTTKEIKTKILASLKRNLNFDESLVFGIPGTFLDEKFFDKDAAFLDDAPFLQILISNPNHIGCHTIDNLKTEPYFKGTQEIEKHVISICAEQLFLAEKDSYDGYVASGGTEANIQAIWVYRNLFMKKYNPRFPGF